MGFLGTIAVGMLLGAGTGPKDAGVNRAFLEQFVPRGWEAGECPKAYGPDSVLCAATDQGPFKVDHHVPTAWIRMPRGGCKQAREVARREAERKGFTLSSEVVGRCGSSGAPCVEHLYRHPKPDVASPVEYVLCPAGGHPLVVSYGVSSRVAAEFHDVARRQVRWAEGQQPAVHTDSIQIGPDATLEGTAGDPILDLVRSHRPELERCRADAVAAGRVPVGRLVLKWQIGADGRVASAETVTNETNDPTLVSCMLAKLRTWQFPRPKGGGAVFVTCPFQFRSGG